MTATPFHIVSFGKFKGRRWTDVPAPYLRWILRNVSDESTRRTAADTIDCLGCRPPAAIGESGLRGHYCRTWWAGVSAAFLLVERYPKTCALAVERGRASELAALILLQCGASGRAGSVNPVPALTAKVKEIGLKTLRP